MTLDLTELERLEREATAGPWEEDGYRAYCRQDGERTIIFETKHFDARGLNTELIVAARNALPELLRAAREATRLREHVRVLREALTPVAGQAIEHGATELPAYIVRDARQALAATAPEGKP